MKRLDAATAEILRLNRREQVLVEVLQYVRHENEYEETSFVGYELRRNRIDRRINKALKELGADA